MAHRPLHCVNWYLASHRMQLDVEDVLPTNKQGNISVWCHRQTDQWFNVDSWVTQQIHACNSQNRISTLERKEIGFWGSFNNGVQKEKSNADQNCLWTTIAALRNPGSQNHQQRTTNLTLAAQVHSTAIWNQTMYITIELRRHVMCACIWYTWW